MVCPSAAAMRAPGPGGLLVIGSPVSRTANSSPPSRPTAVDGAHDPLQRLDDPAQKFVPGAVAEGVVDGLEVIDVEHHDRARPLPSAHRFDLPAHGPLLKTPPVQAAGQGVGAGDRLQRLALWRLWLWACQALIAPVHPTSAKAKPA